MVWQCGKTDMKFVMNQPNTVRPADHMLPGPVINEIKCVQPGQANAELTVVAEHDAPDCDISFLSCRSYFLWQVHPVISPKLACASLLTGHQQSQSLRR